MGEEYHITRLFDEDLNTPMEDGEGIMLEELIIMAIRKGDIKLPDRHPGARKARRFEISFVRDDYKDLHSPRTDITMYVREKRLI